MLNRRILLGVLVILNLYLFLTLIWGGSGFLAYQELKARHSGLESQLRVLQEKSKNLSVEIRRLTSDPAYQRQVVRERMNYVGEKEVLYIFPQAGENRVDGGTKPSQAAPTSEADNGQ